MKKFASISAYLFGTLFLFLTFSGCSSVPEIASSPNHNDITIDGNQKDWGTSFIPVKNENVAVAFRNDGENLYVCLITSDNQKIVKILSMGLTVWLYPSDSKDAIGVQYPVKKTFEEMRVAKDDININPEDVNGRIQHLLSIQNELIIVDDNNIGIYSSSPDADKGFKAKIGYSMNQLVYELKVPLKGNKDFTQVVLNAKSLDNIGVTFETGKFQNNKVSDQERGESGEGGGGRHGGGGMGGSHGGGMGRGGNRSGGSGGRDNTPLKYEFKVKLAAL